MIRSRVVLTRVVLLACAALSINKIFIFSSVPVHAAGQRYTPRIVHEGSGFVGETQTYRLEMQQPYAGLVTWYVNGEKQAATNAVFMPTFSLPGQKVVTVRLVESREITDLRMEIRSFYNVTLDSLVPHPFAPDPEEIVVRNHNHYPVSLRNWRLQSQTSLAMAPLSELIPPHDTVTIRVERKLINNGGAYGLYNEADQLVDVVTYGNAPPGERLIRTQTRWYFPSQDVVEPVGFSAPTVLLSPGVVWSSGAPELQASTPAQHRVAGSVGIRIWINLLIVGGAVLLLSSWPKKPV